MKYFGVIISMLFNIINTVHAQVTISTSDLTGTKWQLASVYDRQEDDYYEYNQGTEIWHRPDNSTFEYPYYLSNTIPDKFDYSKVGVITQGRYFIKINPKDGRFFCYSIISFSKTTGELIMQIENKDILGSRNPTVFYLMPVKQQRGVYTQKRSAIQQTDW